MIGFYNKEPLPALPLLGLQKAETRQISLNFGDAYA
jgi:hypothetical protein